jgi:hypothetical protein
MQIAVQTLILHSRERMNEHSLKVRLSKDDCFKITAEMPHHMDKRASVAYIVARPLPGLLLVPPGTAAY